MKQNCVVCNKELELVNDNKYQPYDGCEIQIIGAFGSRKFDEQISATVYRGVICDECAEKLVPKMDKEG